MTDYHAETTHGEEPSPAGSKTSKHSCAGRTGGEPLALSPALAESSSLDALYEASRKAKRNVGWKESVIGFNANLIPNLLRLKRELTTSTYKMRPYAKFAIREPKERMIEATALRDRIVQKSACSSYLYERLTRSLIHDSGASQEGKGTGFARKRLKHLLHNHWLRYGWEGYAAYIDVKGFFYSIPHDYALGIVAKHAPDPFALSLVEMAMEGHGGTKGLGLGSELSQIVALSVLSGIDHWAKEKAKAKAYVRYMDDSVAVFPDKEQARAYMEGAKRELSLRGLTPSPRKTRIYPVRQGLTFCGWRYMPKPNGRIVLKPRKGKIAELRRRWRRMKKAGVPIPDILQSAESSISSLEWGDARKEIKQLRTYIKEEIQDGVRSQDQSR